MLAESVDERIGLRHRVLSDPDDWRARAGLRALDEQCRALQAAIFGKASQADTDPSLAALEDLRRKPGRRRVE